MSKRSAATCSCYGRFKSATKVKLITASDCQLAVSRYPKFAYNASSGGGWGTVQQLGDNKLRITFDTTELLIPDLNWRTASVLGLPIPPPLNIAIRPNKFEGVLDLGTGQLDMNFSADFDFTHSAGHIHKADGQRLSNGQVKLVGVARVAKVDDAFLSTFLMLPTDALAVMKARLEFS
ncbi:hypothetical protein COO60DRAFT_1699303 [Scenedesmus sp. NREL 46B-D3]|nr:hypothetical protein COO60DRAFT_1699303 [Scenedesmus sp. NREL 46B-D3]